MTKFPHLNIGDIVDIIAPSRKPGKSSVKLAIKTIEEWGLKPRVPDNIIGNSLLFSNNDTERLQQIKTAFNNKDSKVIWCIKGGYGCTRLMPELLNFNPKQPKLLIGFSDITALHIWINQHLNWPSLHAPILEQVASNYTQKSTISALKSILFGKKDHITYKPLTPMNQAAQKTTKIHAPIVGGNLSIVQAGIGTKWQLNTENKILFVEDIDERGYRVDGMLEQYKQSRVLNNPKALILGDFTNGLEANGKTHIPKVLENFASSQSYPVYRYKKIGHNKTNQPLPLGINYTIEQKDNKILMECIL